MPKISRGSPPKVFLGKGALKICSIFTGEHLCRYAIVNLLYIFGTTFSKKTSGGLLLNQGKMYKQQKAYPNIPIDNNMSLSLHMEMRECNKIKFLL